MNCLLCGQSETQFHLNRGKRIAVKHPGDVTGIICSRCMQILLTSSQEKIKEAYQVALDKGMLDKARVLETFLEGEIIENGPTKRSNRAMDRERALRKTGTAYHKVRPEHTVRQLDKRRVAVC